VTLWSIHFDVLYMNQTAEALALVDEVDAEEVQYHAAKHEICECPAIKVSLVHTMSPTTRLTSHPKYP